MLLLAEGNALSKKLRNQIKKTEKKMKQLLMEYNSSRDQLKEETKRSCQELNFDLIKRQETFNLEDSGTDVTAVPVSIKRHAIEMLNLLKRSEEEKAILSGEMKQMFYHYRNDEAKVSSSINMLSLNDEVNRFEAGSLALLKAEQQILQKRLSQIRDSFKNLVELPDVNYSHPAAENDEDNESGDTDTQSSENI
jgi:exonuclease VII small subunit